MRLLHKEELINMIRSILSFIASVGFIIVVSYYFVTAPNYYSYDKDLSKYIFAPGTLSKHRSEGFATTYNGLHGVKGIENITIESRKKIIIWGDSYIEALQVNDDDKTAQVVTRKLKESGLGLKFMCFGVGESGDSAADYYFNIPKYEQVVGGVVAHYILFTAISDILPDSQDDNARGIFKSDPFLLYQDNWKPQFDEIKKILYDYNLYFLREPLTTAVSSIKNLRFIPSVTTRNVKDDYKKEVIYSTELIQESWKYLLKQLRGQSKLPITFIYAPRIPWIKNGHVLSTDSQDRKIALFSEIASQFDIEIIDASGALVAFYNQTGSFPRGFPNSEPSNGHFNKYGHAIISDLIVKDFEIKRAR